MYLNKSLKITGRSLNQNITNIDLNTHRYRQIDTNVKCRTGVNYTHIIIINDVKYTAYFFLHIELV